MKQRSRTLEIVIAVLALLTIAATLVIASDSTTLESLPPAPTAVVEDSCARPTPEIAGDCAMQEAAILASTVQLVMRTDCHDEGGVINKAMDVSLGTVLSDRYVVTHNHFTEPLTETVAGCVTSLDLVGAGGRLLLKNAPMQAYEARLAGPEMILLDFGDYGLLTTLGLLSAACNPAASAMLLPGMEVAQVDWDGARMFVRWVTLTNVRREAGAGVVELDYFAAHGASGGGVFYEGFHIANNWYRTSLQTATGDRTEESTVAALNSCAFVTAQ